jgi:hypothetical protein
MGKSLLKVSWIKVLTVLGCAFRPRWPRTCCVEVFERFSYMIKSSPVSVIGFLFTCDL